MRKRKVTVPAPSRVRKITGSFGWLDHRLLRKGHLEQITVQDLAVYSFLVLAADKNGVSFYRKEKISRILGLDIGEVFEAVEVLKKRDLIAFRPFSRASPDGFYQVLDVPGSCPAGSLKETLSGRGRGSEAIGVVFQRILPACDVSKGGPRGKNESRTVGRDSTAQKG